MVPACTDAPKTESGCLRAGKLKTVAHVYPPWHMENKEKKKEERTTRQLTEGRLINGLMSNSNCMKITQKVCLYSYFLKFQRSTLASSTSNSRAK